ncbi:MAG: four helix bundle protein [Brevefilum fermentans]|uniref:four helix bundle protein n=1 Tax=Candidatus Brevifilum fermentans TaxID=1986204 RepID=UPI000B421B84
MCFLHIARGSFFVTLTLIKIFIMWKWIDKDLFNPLLTQSNEIARMINDLFQSIRQKFSNALHI